MECGVDWLAFPLQLHHHPEDITEREAAGIIAGLSSPHRAVLITYLDDAREVVTLSGRLGVKIVQLHGDISLDELEAIRGLDPDLTIVKSLVIGCDDRHGLESWLSRFAPYVDAFITDTFDPSSGARGATGLVHDWRVSRTVVECSPKPVILAGGLTPLNVARAIEVVKPAGVDAHTGLEDTRGRKDAKRVRAFVTAARRGFRANRA